jgi:two-component system, response regulator PdtaR
VAKVQQGASRGRVVVVEDDGLVAGVVGLMLTDLGYDVVGTAMDGLVALRVVTQQQPDVVLMDLVMPGIGGITAARRIQAIRPTPVVVLTAYEPPELTPSLREAGVVACLEKPVTKGDLDQAIMMALTGLSLG